MIVEYIRYELTSHPPDALIDAYREAGALLRAAPECLGYDLAQRDDAPNTLILRVHWETADAHMQGFRKGPHFPRFLQLIRPFINEIAEMKHYYPTDVEWQREAR